MMIITTTPIITTTITANIVSALLIMNGRGVLVRVAGAGVNQRKAYRKYLEDTNKIVHHQLNNK
jgi:hypothetical protein